MADIQNMNPEHGFHSGVGLQKHQPVPQPGQAGVRWAADCTCGFVPSSLLDHLQDASRCGRATVVRGTGNVTHG